MFVLAMLGVIVISVIFLYQSGRITTEKMQLQNGADAAAYTSAALEARAMNFSAYTNRAMVANEIAIAQAVGLLSFANELKSVRTYLNTYATIINAASLGAATPFTTPMRAIGNGFGKVGGSIEKAIGKVAPYWIKTFSIVNSVYSVTQNIYQYTTAMLVMDGIYKSLNGNVVGTQYGSNLFKNLFAPPKSYAKPSTISMVALAGHFYTYLNGYTKRFSQTSEKDADGMKRLAAVTRLARDDFSSGVGNKNRNWMLDLGFDIDIKILELGFHVGVYSKGGTELVKKKDSFIWAAGDTGAFIAKAKLGLGFKPLRIGIKLKSPDIPIGVGGYQVGDKKHTLAKSDLSKTKSASNPASYGGAPEHKLTWPFAENSMAKNKVAQAPYNGLKKYRDVDTDRKKGMLDKMPFSFPFFLIAVEKDYEHFKKEGPQFSDEFNLVQKSENFGKKIAAAAKAEVYFSRPQDLSYFKRKDGNKEKDNLFSPFWQARLVPTNDIDRVFILAMQQNTIWLSGADLKKIPTGIMDTIVRKLENFLKILP